MYGTLHNDGGLTTVAKQKSEGNATEQGGTPKKKRSTATVQITEEMAIWIRVIAAYTQRNQDEVVARHLRDGLSHEYDEVRRKMNEAAKRKPNGN